MTSSQRSLSASLLGSFAVLLSACSSSTNGGTTSGTGGGTSGGPDCSATTALTVSFSPMYSATDFDPTLSFQIPAVVSGVNNANIAWYASPEGVVSLTPTTAAQQAENLGDVIITVDAASAAALGDGGVTITAEAITDAGGTGLCGTSALQITSCTTDQYDAGFQRYHYGQILTDDGGCGTFQSLLSGGYSGAACINCHGATANLNFDNELEITDVQHTPEQTGGFSDQQMTNIITQGEMPDANYFTNLDQNGNDTGLTYAEWQSFHKWTFDSSNPDELPGIICYLRSLTPEPQTGAANFGHGGGPGGGGGGPPDGGMFFGGDGGGFGGDGGFGGRGDGGGFQRGCVPIGDAG